MITALLCTLFLQSQPWEAKDFSLKRVGPQRPVAPLLKVVPKLSITSGIYVFDGVEESRLGGGRTNLGGDSQKTYAVGNGQYLHLQITYPVKDDHVQYHIKIYLTDDVDNLTKIPLADRRIPAVADVMTFELGPYRSATVSNGRILLKMSGKQRFKKPAAMQYKAKIGFRGVLIARDDPEQKNRVLANFGATASRIVITSPHFKGGLLLSLQKAGDMTHVGQITNSKLEFVLDQKRYVIYSEDTILQGGPWTLYGQYYEWDALADLHPALKDTERDFTGLLAYEPKN